MAVASERARFYLERDVPELHEFQRRGVFTREEVQSIAKKRSDFEHIINDGRAANPSDYARYSTYEINLDTLRAKRVKRLGIKDAAAYQGQRRVFFILSRAVRKFPGDMALWMQYIEYARSCKSYRKLKEILTQVLRLHPTKSELWIYAARYVLETDADMTSARSYMQRGLRFCQKDQSMWLEYAKLEMFYIAKLHGRRKVLGLDEVKKSDEQPETLAKGGSMDKITLPTVTAEDVNPSLGEGEGEDKQALQNLADTPALSGAIPIAIYDAAMKVFKEDSDGYFMEKFFDMIAAFDDLPSTYNILNHIHHHMTSSATNAVLTWACSMKLCIFGVEPTSPDFPRWLERSLSNMEDMEANGFGTKEEMAERTLCCYLPAWTTEDVDPAIDKVLTSVLRKNYRRLGKGGGDKLAAKLKSQGRSGLAEALATFRNTNGL